MKLWQKDYELDKKIEDFTVGNDFMLDSKLLKYDIIASIAHAKMLSKVGLLKEKELKKIIQELKKIKKLPIKKSDEDVHTALENHLVSKLGELGKKIHTARSRNDQVLVAIRLYSKDEILKVKLLVNELVNSLNETIKKYGNVKMPGYTHMQKAMPSSVEIWMSAFVASLKDDLKLLEGAYELNDQCPLGSAAGYGVPLQIDKKYTADLLGFSKVQETLYCQNSRGKIESVVLNALSHIMMDLNKLATDMLMFSMPEFGYISLAKEMCTGSSIMPQKKNPDVLELVRAKNAVMQSYLFQVNGIISNLPSGYNRDFQLTKEPLMKGFDLVKDCVSVMSLVVGKMEVNEEKCLEGCTEEIFAAEKAYELVKKGVSFREAYKKVALANKIEKI